MAWTVSKASSDTGYIDGDVQIGWVNSWTITELTPETAGKIRLRIKLKTTEFWTYPSYHIAYETRSLRSQSAGSTHSQK